MKRIFAAIALVVASAMAPAFGQGYLAGYIGQSDYDIDCAGTTSCDTKDTGYKVAGGYMFSPYFGGEVSYTDFGKATATIGALGAQVEATSIGLFAVGVAPIDQFTLFGKLGFASNKLKLTGAVGTVSASDDDTSTEFAWAIGAGYNFSKELGVELEYSATKGKYEGESADITLLAIGVKFRF